MNETDARRRLHSAYLEFERLDLSSGAAGNISVRHGEAMLISPAGAAVANITAERFVLTSLDGRAETGKPSSEWAMHAEIYRRFPAAQAVVHAHPDACTALSCQRRAIPAFHYMIASFGGDDVPCSAYAPFGSIELAAAAGDVLDGRNACLLANHGMICHARSLDEALFNALKLETLARQYILTLQIGPPVILNSEEMAVVKTKYASYGR